jgi:murein DD-endopeptidase MepM/ murein hydrolase activator NlpD
MNSRDVLILGGLAALFFLPKSGAGNILSPVVGKITSPFGNRKNPYTGEIQFHNGVDIGVPTGTKIKAPLPGIVTSIFRNDIGGLQLTIKHDNGFKSGYAHLSDTIKKQGDKVKRGEVFALSGASGKVTGAHLHFTLRNKNGELIDGAKYIKSS